MSDGLRNSNAEKSDSTQSLLFRGTPIEVSKDQIQHFCGGVNGEERQYVEVYSLTNTLKDDKKECVLIKLCVSSVEPLW